MHHRGSSFVRLFVFLLFLGAVISIGRGLYRSGFEQGFTQGMVFATTDGEAVAGPRAVPPFYGGPGPAGFGPSFPGGGLLALAFLTFFAMMFMGAVGRRHRHQWAHAGHGRHGCGPGRHERDTRDDIGPEKQPQDFV